MLSICHEHESRRRWHESRWRIGRRRWGCRTGDLIHSVTVPWRTPFSWPDSLSSGPIFSQFPMASYPKICIKVVELQTSYTSAIGIELSWALDPGWILVQRWLCYIVSLKFRVQSAWQPDFRLNYLQFFHNNLAYTLKQNCSPMLGLQIWCGALRWILTDLKVIKLQSWAYNPDFRLSIELKWGPFCK
jgi:hypothetical protein